MEEKGADLVTLARLSLRLYRKFIELKEADETDFNIAALTQAMEKDVT